MKKLFLASLILSVAGTALAATVVQHGTSATSTGISSTNLDATVQRHENPQADSPAFGARGSAGPRKVLEGEDLSVNKEAVPRPFPVELRNQPVFETAEEAMYYRLKHAGEQIPAWLIEAVFGPGAEPDATRDGGDGPGDAVEITFEAGGSYFDSGTTIGYADNFTSGNPEPQYCNTSSYTSSFLGPEAWYTFTLPDAYEVEASTCDMADYDTVLGILNESMELVAMNDDGDGCPDFSSWIEPCCLAAGTYYLIVDAYGGYEGTYDLEVNFSYETCTPPEDCEEWDCTDLWNEDEGYYPGEDPPVYEDYTNGGCNVEPPLFQEVECAMEFCGTFFTFYNPDTGFDTRDMDWFEVTVFEPSYITFDGHACEEYNMWAFGGDCDNMNQLAFVTGMEALSMTTDCVPAGTYMFIIAPAGFTGIPEEAVWHVEISCEPCEYEDPCEELELLTCETTDLWGSNVGMQNYVGNDAGDVFYELLIEETTTYRITLCSTNTDYDTYLRLYDICPTDPNAVQLAYDDDGPVCDIDSAPYEPSEIAGILDAGTYYVVVEGFGSGEGNYGITVECEPPAGNDTWEGAIEIESLPFSDSGDTQGMSNAMGPYIEDVQWICDWLGTFFTNSGGGPDAWYHLTLDEPATITGDLCESSYDTVIGVFLDTGETPTLNDLVTGNDDECGLQSTFFCDLPAGEYYIVVDGYGTGAGPFVLYVDEFDCTPVECEGVDEGEPNNGPEEFDGDNTFGVIECDQTVCGTTWAAEDQRDTDWFEFLLMESSFVTLEAEVDFFNCLLFIIDGAYNVVTSVDVNGYCEGETLVSDCLMAGTYYAWIGHNAFSGVDEASYALTMTCDPCEIPDPCEDPYPLSCNETVVGDNTMSLGNAWETYCFGGEDGPEVVYELEHQGGFLIITMTSGGAEDLDLVLLGSCNPLDCLDMPYLFGSDETIEGTYDAGTYYVVVDAWSYGGTDYDFTLTVTCGDDPCDDVEPVECDGTPEEEPNEGWNADPPNDNYGNIVCGETVCGTVWADAGTRDLDWFRLDHTGGDIEVTTEIEYFNCILFLTYFDPDLGVIVSADTQPWCVPETITYAGLPAGEYYIVIAHNDFYDVPDEQNYALTLTCLGDPCEGHEPIVCDGTDETEPNEGWNADPPNSNYGTIGDGETICGTVWADEGTRDTDWYYFELEDTYNIEISSEIDWFDAIVFLTDFDPDGSILGAVDNEPACHGEYMLYECLAPGEYFIAFMHNDFYDIPDEEAYALTMVLGDCTPPDPCGDMVDAGELNDIYEAERPAPIANHHNAINGCPGGISSSGWDELHMLVINEQTDILITHQGEDDADEVVYVLSDCNTTESCIAGMDQNGSDPGAEELQIDDIPAGTYYIVADYWGAAEAAPFVLTVDDLGVDVDEILALSFELMQNYPNPFNPVTTISWSQPRLSRASLTIHNILGEVVQSFDLGFRGAGSHSLVWDASALSSGVYLYTLDTGEHSRTMKAVLLK